MLQSNQSIFKWQRLCSVRNILSDYSSTFTSAVASFAPIDYLATVSFHLFCKSLEDFHFRARGLLSEC